MTVSIQANHLNLIKDGWNITDEFGVDVEDDGALHFVHTPVLSTRQNVIVEFVI